MKRAIFGIVLSAAAFGQSLSFDAASIKPAPPPDGKGIRVSTSGGPGTKDPGLYTCQNCTASMLICEAYDMRTDQLSNGPSPLDGARFNITARVPEGTTKEQFRLMLQSLLAERFGLQAHHESKELPIYALVVAKNGSKLKESAPAAVADDPQASATTASGRPKFELGKDGFPILPLGTGVSMIMMNGRARSRWPGYTLKQLAVMLSGQVGKPVTDASGLTGKYDITLSWADDGARGGAGNPPAPADGGAFPVAGTPDADALPNIFAAIQEQLGLKLEAKKGMVDILVIDHVEKTPSNN